MMNKNDLKSLAMLGLIAGMMVSAQGYAGSADESQEDNGEKNHSEMNGEKDGDANKNGDEGNGDANSCSGPGGCGGKSGK